MHCLSLISFTVVAWGLITHHQSPAHVHARAHTHQGNLILTPWCELKSTEEMVKEATKATKPAAGAAAAAASAAAEVDSGSGEAFQQLSGAAKVGPIRICMYHGYC